jgi:hypothetical protein
MSTKPAQQLINDKGAEWHDGLFYIVKKASFFRRNFFIWESVHMPNLLRFGTYRWSFQF